MLTGNTHPDAQRIGRRAQSVDDRSEPLGRRRSPEAAAAGPGGEVFGPVGGLERGVVVRILSGQVEGEDARLRKIVREEPRGLAAECPELEDRLALEDRCERAQDQWAKTSDRSVHPDGLDAAEA